MDPPLGSESTRGVRLMKEAANRSTRPSGNRWVSATADGRHDGPVYFAGSPMDRSLEEHVWPKWVSGLLCGRKSL